MAYMAKPVNSLRFPGIGIKIFESLSVIKLIPGSHDGYPSMVA